MIMGNDQPGTEASRTCIPYSKKNWQGVNCGSLVSLSKDRQFKNSPMLVSVPVHTGVCTVYVHEPSLEARPAGRSSPKFKSPSIFHLTDLPNIMLAKLSRYTVYKLHSEQYFYEPQLYITCT